MQEGKFRPSAGTEIAAEGEVDSSKNAVPDITADILTAEACNLRICCEKTDHRNGNKLNRNSDDQSEKDSNQCIAYINGQRCTDSELVMSHMKLSMNQVSQDTEDFSIESQLGSLFDTAEDEQMDITNDNK